MLLTLNDQRSETPRKARVLDKIRRGTELYLRLTQQNILILILPSLGTHVLNQELSRSFLSRGLQPSALKADKIFYISFSGIPSHALELADMLTHISRSVSVSEYYPFMVIFTNIINLYDNILINKYQGLITCNRLTPLHCWSRLETCSAQQ